MAYFKFGPGPVIQEVMSLKERFTGDARWNTDEDRSQ